MDRIAGIETEYGCLSLDPTHPHGVDSWPLRVKDYLFKTARLGAIDLHYRDYEEPPGNGGFLRNGGRLYIDMGHIEYASPECRSLRDMVAYDLAGDRMLQSALEALGVADRVAFLKNNIDHHTGATFGCHENFLMRRQTHFHEDAIGTLLSFLATRQIFTGSGRVGRARISAFQFETPQSLAAVDFQMSQRADHIVNDVYQWVQFNRAIINARDEPLADENLFRRLHLLLGDSNMSPYATALKIGTTALALRLVEEGELPREVVLFDAVAATQQISHTCDVQTAVKLSDGRLRSALEIQHSFLDCACRHFAGRDEETDWLLAQWRFVLEALESNPEALIGGVDWLSKRWLLEAFRESEGLEWNDPWLESQDLEYHNINPERGLFFALPAQGDIAMFNDDAFREACFTEPPQDTRACGRGLAVSRFLDAEEYLVNWDSVSNAHGVMLEMPNPMHDYRREVEEFLRPKTTVIRQKMR